MKRGPSSAICLKPTAARVEGMFIVEARRGFLEVNDFGMDEGGSDDNLVENKDIEPLNMRGGNYLETKYARS